MADRDNTPVVTREVPAAMFGYLGSMKCHPGRREDVVAILMSGLDGLAAVGCQQYTVAVDASDEATIWVSEVWLTKQAHEDSLELPETQEAIKRAMPMLTGEFSGVETYVYGGLGLPHLPHHLEHPVAPDPAS